MPGGLAHLVCRRNPQAYSRLVVSGSTCKVDALFIPTAGWQSDGPQTGICREWDLEGNWSGSATKWGMAHDFSIISVPKIFTD